MVNLSFEEATEKHLETLYRHLSVQSILDMKAVNKEVSVGVLKGIYTQASKKTAVFYDGRLAYIAFFIPTDVNEFAVYIIDTTLGYKDKEGVEKSFESLIRDLQNYKLYSIVYTGNHRYIKLLKDNGFRFVRNIVHGAEKRKFFLLGKNVDGEAST